MQIGIKNSQHQATPDQKLAVNIHGILSESFYSDLQCNMKIQMSLLRSCPIKQQGKITLRVISKIAISH